MLEWYASDPKLVIVLGVAEEYYSPDLVTDHCYSPLHQATIQVRLSRKTNHSLDEIINVKYREIHCPVPV